MFCLQLSDRIVTVTIEYKKNKNTYFRFHKENTIKVTAPKRQSKKNIKEYIIKNEIVFIKKLDAVRTFEHDANVFSYFNEIYQIQRNGDQNGYHFDEVKKIVTIPKLDIDREYLFLKNMSKELLLEALGSITDKHRNNGHINIDRINLKTRYMTSRYGSCNKVKRNINMNLYLVHYDIKFLEYVFLHEITHLKVSNHSQLFYKTFQKLCPNYLELRRALKRIYTHR